MFLCGSSVWTRGAVLGVSRCLGHTVSFVRLLYCTGILKLLFTTWLISYWGEIYKIFHQEESYTSLSVYLKTTTQTLCMSFLAAAPVLLCPSFTAPSTTIPQLTSALVSRTLLQCSLTHPCLWHVNISSLLDIFQVSARHLLAASAQIASFHNPHLDWVSARVNWGLGTDKCEYCPSKISTFSYLRSRKIFIW